ncbi:MAG: glycoside hydrolase family 13 protein [Firmicutes bacterium]|nr:glycoside hydrolase family 13 protein [Bacillota bacterium]
MIAEHNSQSKIYREPFGAQPAGGKAVLRLSLVDAGIPEYIRLHTDACDETQVFDMHYVFEAAGVYFYEAGLTLPQKPCLLRYWFEVRTGGETVFYGNNEENLGGIGRTYDEIPYNKFQITVYDGAYKTPKWWRESICYQIFPDRFFNGTKDGKFLGTRQDIIKRNWGEAPYYKADQFGGKYLANDFFGGNLLGIEKKLPYLKSLGISSIYLNPIFSAFSNHRYDTADYKKIDEMLGNEKDFSRLCKKAEDMGIRIILDGVFNHTGSDSIYFNKNGNYSELGAYQSKESPYYKWFNFMEYPEVYESWWGIDTLPQVNEASCEYQDYIIKDKDSVVRRWLKKGACGWRIDVVDELPGFFVKLLRKAVKEENPDAVIIGEVWEDASNKVSYNELREYFYGDELDSVMNYPLKNAMVDFALCRMDAKEFDRRIMSLKENYPRPSFYAALNFLSTHDTARILTVMGGKEYQSKDEQALAKLCGEDYRRAEERLKCLVTMQFTLPGVPTVFYGDEAGCEGFADPFCRGCYPWGNENHSILEHYKYAIALRNENDVLKNGEFETVYKYENCYGFIRFDKRSKIIVLVNFGEDTEIRLDVARYGVFSLRQANGEECHSADGIFCIKMPKNCAKVLFSQ